MVVTAANEAEEETRDFSIELADYNQIKIIIYSPNSISDPGAIGNSFDELLSDVGLVGRVPPR